MARHQDLTGTALHVPGYITDTDPGAVGAGILWIDTTDPAAPVMKMRSDDDTAWVDLSTAGGGASYSLPDPATGSPGDVVTVNGAGDNYELDAPSGGGGGGSGALITGSALLYEADTLSSTPGTAIGTWADQSGHGHDLTATSTTRPLYQEEDGVPFLSFDGVNDSLRVTGMSSYTGTGLTVFLVARMKYIGNTNILAITKASTAENAATAFCVGSEGFEDHGMVLKRNSSSYGFPYIKPNINTGYSGYFPKRFTLIALRWSVVLGRAVVRMRVGSYESEVDLGTSLPAFDLSVLGVGSGLDSSSGSAAQEYAQCDVRALAVYQSALGDLAFEQMSNYLAEKYGGGY